MAFSGSLPATALALRGFDPYLVGFARAVIAVLIAAACLLAAGAPLLIAGSGVVAEFERLGATTIVALAGDDVGALSQQLDRIDLDPAVPSGEQDLPATEVVQPAPPVVLLTDSTAAVDIDPDVAAAAETVVRAARRRLKGRMEVIYVLPDYYTRYPKPCMGGWGRRQLTVIPNGDVLPCPAAHTLPLPRANVREHGLAALGRVIFNSNEFLYVD